MAGGDLPLAVPGGSVHRGAQLAADVLGNFGLVEEPIAGPGADFPKKGVGDIDIEDNGLAAGTQHAPYFSEGFHLEIKREVVEKEGGHDALKGGIGPGQFLGEGSGKFKAGAVAGFLVGDGDHGFGGIDAADPAGGGDGQGIIDSTGKGARAAADVEDGAGTSQGEPSDHLAVQAVLRAKGHEGGEPVIERGGMIKGDAGGTLGDW